MKEAPRLFFITGCQRSGTTLVRLVLESHPEVGCFDEQWSYELLPELRGKRARDVIASLRKRCVGFKVPRYAEQLLQRSTDDPDYGRGPAFYRREPVVFLLRDANDVIASMLALKYPDGTSWLDKFGAPILAHAARGRAFARRYRAALQLIEQGGFSGAAAGALYWRYKTDAFFDYREAGLPVLGVVYERLVAAPRPQLARVLRFLGLEWDERVLEHPRFEHGELDIRGRAIGGTDPLRAIDAASVGRHRAELSERERAAVAEIAGPTLLRLKELASEEGDMSAGGGG